MKRTYYLTTAMIPGAFGMHRWDQKQSEVADIVVSSELARNFDIAEMNLHLKRFSVLDKDGRECFVRDFSRDLPVRIRGLSAAALLVTRETKSLEQGEYQKLRFYIEPKAGKMVHTDYTVSSVGDREYLEFDMEETLKVGARPPQELVLRFDFPPAQRFNFSIWRSRFNQWLGNGKSRITGRLSGSKM